MANKVSPGPSELDWLYRRYANEIEGVKPYSYYDTPASEEGLEKTYYCCKEGARIGLICGAADVTLVSRAKGLIPIAGRFAYWVIPWATAGGAFAASNFALAKLRKKDTLENHVFSSFVAGSVFGSKWNSFRCGFIGGCLFGVMAFGAKYCAEVGVPMFPLLKNPNMTFYSLIKHDWSLTREDGE